MTKQIEQTYDFVVAGGGLAGVCAAIAAARRGLKTCLVQERPVLGGNASSEIRVTSHGAGLHHVWARETGIIAEIQAEERFRNHAEVVCDGGWTNSVFDQVLYDFVTREPNLTLHLNTSVTGVLMDGADGQQANVPPNTDKGYYERPACAPSKRIAALVARTLSAEVELILRAPLFVDATGDALVADLAGCEWRMGTESKAETGEWHATERASTDTMGNSIYIHAINTGKDAPFTPPPWAALHHDADFFYKSGRNPWDPRGGFWWIEIGMPWHTIHDNETIRFELTRHAYGVWDWMKNHDPVMKEKCRTWALDFLGQVPGKRESRRVMGRHLFNEHEIQARAKYPDEVAYGGWRIDLHTPGGLLAATSEQSAAEGFRDDTDYAVMGAVGPYGVPLRSLMARDVDNLFLAGRCFSATHVALGSPRNMATLAVMAQAVGTAAALMRERGIDLPALAEDAARGGEATQALQQTLLRDGCFLLNVSNRDPLDLARAATVSASSSALLHGLSPHDPAPNNLWRGENRTLLWKTAAQNLWCGGRVDRLELCLDNDSAAPVQVPARLVTVSDVFDYRIGGSGVIAEGALTVPPGRERWVGWDVSVSGLAAGWLRLEIGPAPEVYCAHTRGLLPGHNSYRHLSTTRLRGDHTGFSFKVSPPQPAFGPEQALTGVTRPQAAPNQWRSDPGQGLPQWLQLEWPSAQTISRVELTFPGQLLGEPHIEPAFFAAQQVAKDYTIEFDSGDGVWREAARVEKNYEWRRVHDLPATVSARRLRVVITATNGDPSASLSEIRCYR